MRLFKEHFEEQENERVKRVFAKRFGERIKKVRKEKGLTQEQVAEKASLHASYYGHIELRRFRPSLYVAWKIARALKVSLDKLTGE